MISKSFSQANFCDRIIWLTSTNALAKSIQKTIKAYSPDDSFRHIFFPIKDYLKYGWNVKELFGDEQNSLFEVLKAGTVLSSEKTLNKDQRNHEDTSNFSSRNLWFDLTKSDLNSGAYHEFELMDF